MSALVTEHFALQSSASATISESSSRTSVYLLSLSSSLVALGFATGNEAAFGAMAGAILPTIFLLGCFTLVRLVDTSIENVDALRGIAAIRGYYRNLTPEAPTYFPTLGSVAQDANQMLGIRYRPSSVLFTLASMVGTVNAVLGGASVALLLASGLRTSLVVAVASGAVLAVVLWAGMLVYQGRRFASQFSPADDPAG